MENVFRKKKQKGLWTLQYLFKVSLNIIHQKNTPRNLGIFLVFDIQENSHQNIMQLEK